LYQQVLKQLNFHEVPQDIAPRGFPIFVENRATPGSESLLRVHRLRHVQGMRENYERHCLPDQPSAIIELELKEAQYIGGGHGPMH